jgi:anti-sigma B factor antagonist
VQGTLEEINVPAFRGAMSTLPPGASLVLDLEALSFIDSTGLGALIAAVRRVRDMGGDAVVCRPQPSVARAMQLVALRRVVDVAAEPEDALLYLLLARAA